MKRVIVCMSVAALLGVTIKIATAKEPTVNAVISSTVNDVDSYISGIYKQIDFTGKERLSFDAFSTAFRGYLNLKEAGKLSSDKQILTVADFTQSSTKHRLWIIDLAKKAVLLNDYVAHGQGSGDEFATNFSNNNNSHQSSIGFYVTGDTYIGNHGNSLRLYGMDNGYNSAAYDRAVVVHGADYVNDGFVAGQKRLGRSWGCPAVSNQLIGKVINYIGGGTCLFIYYPQKNYMASSTWLNRKVDHLPEDYIMKDLIDPATVAKSNKPVKIEYAANAQDLNPASPLYVSPEMKQKRETLLAMNFGFIGQVLP